MNNYKSYTRYYFMKFKPLQKSILGVFTLSLFLISFTSIAQSPKAEILWDTYGVPHIYAESTADMYYAYGWSQMKSHSNLLLRLYAQSRGKAAEYFGPDFLESDKLIHLFDLPAQAEKNYAKQRPDFKPYLDAFVNGINDYASKHPEEIGAAFQKALPISPTDVLAHANRILGLEFLGRNDITNSKRLLEPGSNSIAIAPSKSRSSNAMLLSNPHLPWADFFTFYEAHLNAPDFMAYGVSLIGFPALSIAFNENLGWTHTVNTIDGSDRYELALKDGGYELDGKILDFEEKSVSLNVMQADGNMKTEEYTFRYSAHGPIVGEKNNKAYAVRIAGLDNALIAEQFHNMAKAADFAEFESALKMMQLSMFNVIYADNAGNIMYLFDGNVPIRKEGDWDFWSGTVDGTSSKYIWDQTHPYEDLPKVYNPPTGFVQNANDPPWTSTYPIALDPAHFPSYMSPIAMGLRPQRAVNMIKDNASISYDELVGYKMNTEMEAAHRFLDDLLDAVASYPDSMAVAAADVLKAWDKSTNADSKGAILFEQWFGKMNKSMIANQWSLANPISTPNGLSDPQKAVGILTQAAEELLQKYGSLDMPYGELNRFRKDKYDFPANGGSDQLGVFRTMYFSPDRDKKNRAFHGDTYVAVTEFGEKVKASVLLSYGNSSQPGNKHSGDQLQLLSEKKLRPALLDKEDVLKNLEETETLIIPLRLAEQHQ